MPIILGYSSNTLLPLTKRYGSLTELAVDHATSTAIYKHAQTLLAQEPRVPFFKVGLVGRSASPTVPDYTFTLTYTEATPTAGRSVSVAINGEVATYVVQPSDTVTLVHQGLASAINGLPGSAAHTAVGAAGQVTVTAAVAGNYVSASEMNEYLSYKDTTIIGSLVADLAAIAAFDMDWYAILSVSRSEARINAEAVWAAENKKLYLAQTHDTDVPSSSTTDIASDLKGLSNPRTAPFWSRSNDNLLAAAAAGYALTRDPGTYTWALKNLANVSSDSPSAAMTGYLDTKRVTYYQTIAGIPVTRGAMLSDGTFIDIIQSTDWLKSEIEADVFALLVNSPKVPFTDAGIRQISDTVAGAMQRAESVNVLADTPKFYVSSPKALDVASADRANRVLNQIEFNGRLAGAIHKVKIRGTLSV